MRLSVSQYTKRSCLFLNNVYIIKNIFLQAVVFIFVTKVYLITFRVRIVIKLIIFSVELICCLMTFALFYTESTYCILYSNYFQMKIYIYFSIKYFLIFTFYNSTYSAIYEKSSFSVRYINRYINR